MTGVRAFCSNAFAVPRWLLPLIAVLALCGRTVTAFAAAGWVGKTACCCPNPETCKCHEHDHDGKSRPHDTLKRCGGDATLVSPDAPVVTLSVHRPVTTALVVRALVELARPALRSALPVPPEPPPI